MAISSKVTEKACITDMYPPNCNTCNCVAVLAMSELLFWISV